MLYAFYGTDVVGVRKEAHEFLEKYEEKGITIERITAENYVPGSIEDAAGSSSLFWEEQVVVIDTPSGDKEMFEKVFSILPELKESRNIFVIIEEKLLAPEKKKLQKYAEKSEEQTAAKEERFNVFALTDALLRRDKKSLWILLTEAWRNGLSNEEIIGTLYWQVKILRLAEKTSSAEEAGQKPFVYQKAKRALSKFKEGELTQISRDLLAIYHDGHLGKREADVALEKWVLSL